MAGFKNQAWVTAVLTDQDVPKALVLERSLRRSLTSRTVAVLVSPKVSLQLRELLHYEFDSVHILEEDRNVSKLKPEEFAKLYSLTLRVFEKCVFLSPNMLVMKNCDEIFDKFQSLMFTESLDPSVFAFLPSLEVFKALKAGLNNGGQGSLAKYLRIWKQNQTKEIKYLDSSYNNVISAKNGALLRNEKSMSIVNFSEDLSALLSSLSKAESATLGILETMAVKYWQEIYTKEIESQITAALKGTDILPSTLDRQRQYERDPIAIIGMSCRYPGSNNLDEFWELILNGMDAVRTPPDFRWTKDQTSRSLADYRKTNAGFLKVPVDEFDAKFFGISPKEAVYMDPQHRLLHELVWEGLEDAAIDALKLRGTNTGVFVGAWTNDFKDILVHAGNKEFYRLYMGNSIGAAAARISHHLGLTGPSVATESGCSSAMVAVHLACRSLLLGESNLAIASGVNLLLHPFDKDEMPMVISPTGRCKTFDAKADGFARAEGCGVLVMKRLSDAVKDNDHIWALIRGSGMSQEGISRSMGTPTVHCESLAMKKALADAHVTPEQISYVEAHGTGTVVGDPMEISAITAAYHSSNRKEPLIIGSVKTNVGHTESCSGITGIMKVVLALKKETIPPHRNFESLNPAIDLDALPAKIPLEPVPWPKNQSKVRLAGVSSFGITGTDAHAIIEEAPEVKNISTNTTDRPLHLLKISAKTEEALSELLQRFQDHLQTISDEDFPNFAYTANIGRSSFSNRAVIVAKNREAALNSLAKNQVMRKEVSEGDARKICFLFTGQGSQYKGMAQQLYETSPVFRMHFDYCEKILEQRYNINIKDALWSPDSTEVSRTIYSQTSIFCVEYALLKLWESLGVTPNYVLGHSLGEFAAAVCANILSVEDAVMLVAERSRLIDELPRGKMLVIKADQSTVSSLMRKFAGKDIRKMLDYAAVNSSQQTVVAGDSEVVQEFFDYCTQSNVKTVILEATHAFHSKHMEPMLGAYRKIAATVNRPTRQTCEYISGMLGTLSSPEELDAEYWVRHTREKVDFLSASKTAFELGCQIFVEVGPQPVLSALTMMNIEASLICVPSLKRKEPEWNTLLGSLANLYLNGVDIDWHGYDQFYNRRKIRIPHYPFQGKRHWPDMISMTGNTIHPLLGAVIPNATSTKLFQNGINPRSVEFVKDHVIGNKIIFPGSGYLEMCLSAGHATLETCVDSWVKPTRPMKIENLSIEAPLELNESKTCQLQVVVNFIGPDGSKYDASDWTDISVKIFHRLESEMENVKWLSHASATFSPVLNSADKEVDINLEEIISRVTSQAADEKMIREVYDKLASLGLKFGPFFQSLEKVWKDEENNGLLAKVKVPLEDPNFSQYIFHPVILDAAVQAVMLTNHSDRIKQKLHVPISIGKFVWFSSLDTTDQCFIYTHLTKSDGATSFIINEHGKLLAIMSKVELIDTTVKAVESVLEQQTSAMPDLWEESWRSKMGPLQHRIPSDILTNDEIYSDEFTKLLEQNYNTPSHALDETFTHLEDYVYYFMLNALYECGWEPVVGQTFTLDSLVKQLGVKSEHKLFVNYFLKVFQEEGLLTFSNCSQKEWKVVKNAIPHDDIKLKLKCPIYTDDLVKQFDPTRLIARIGEHLPDILQGKQSGLSVLFPESQKNLPTVGDFYEHYGKYFNILPLIARIVEFRAKCWNTVMANRNSGKYVYRICEVGAGTGVFSAQALNVLSEQGVDFEYTYTDISPAFFAGAEKRFEKYVKDIKFKKLNIEECPLSQGLVPGYYDLVIASDVIHATKDVSITLQNLRKLLREGGNIDIMEQTRENRIITHIFGPVQGFWRFEDRFRQDHCILTKDKWEMALKTSGFPKSRIFPAFRNRHGYITGWAGPLNTSILYPIPSSKPTWLVFTVPGLNVGKFLSEMLERYGRKVVTVIPKQTNGFAKSSSLSVHNGKKEDFDMVFANATADKSAIEGIVYLWPLDKTRTAQSDILQPFLYLAQCVPVLKQKLMPRVYAVMEGIVPIDDNDLSHYYPSTLWGFVKAMRNEHTDINCRSISLPANFGNNEMMDLFYELWVDDAETQVAYSGNSRHLARFQPAKVSLQDLPLPSGTDRFQLILPQTKSISDLQFGPLDPFTLERNEIEIQVKTSALNFRDVFSVLKPTEEFKNVNSVGFDFAGIVKRVGAGVSKWKPGDCVFGVNMNRGALPSHIKLPENDVLLVPPHITLCQAATMPAVFATTYHCLIDIAQIKPSDTVLIHTASGGVGLSAIEVVKHIGAEIIATAGSKRKQNYLRSLGIKHIFHSRYTDYGDQILDVTNGRGVDVVLNSLTSEGFKEATLKACAKGARFVEMSKLSIWKPEEVKQLRPDVRYTIADVSSLDPQEWRRLMANLNLYLEKQIVSPIAYVQFDGTNIREALRYLQKAKHIGKVVCIMPELKMERGELKVHTSQFNDRSTYLITGGLGGIGFEVAKWMVDKGAKHIILAGRSAPSKQAQEYINKLNSSLGANIFSVQLDIGNRDQCKELLEKIKSPSMNLPALRGIMHAAGTLSDGLISNHTDWQKFSSTFNTKVNGTLNLHELTKGYALEHFVVFSSVASLFGSPGQSNHAAGNNFEDTFTHYRNSIGLPATSINWGQWGQVGIATEVDLPGMKALSTLQGLTALEYALKAQRVQTCVVNMESFVLFSKLSPQVAIYLDEKIWKSTGTSGSTLVIRSDEFWQEYDTKEGREEKLEVMKNRLKSLLKFILKLDEEEVVDDNTNFQEMGVDSLMFVEIKNALQNLLGERVTITASALRDCNTVQMLSDQLVKLIEGDDMECSKPPTREEIDELLKEDTILPEEITGEGKLPACQVHDIKTVFLTGATGQLGPYVLRELCRRPHVKKIYCLVRPTVRHHHGEVCSQDRLMQHLSSLALMDEIDTSKVHCIEGNVTRENLGITDKSLWNTLVEEVDAIFHCAIRADHVQYYRKRGVKDEDVRSVNITGLQNVLKLACEHKLKHVFHSSSILSVPTTDSEGRLSEDWPEVHDYDGLTIFAYPISKFVGDLLMKTAVDRGIPCKVFRFPIIAGNSLTGRNASIYHNHLMLRYFYIMKCGRMPSNPIPLALIPVDICANTAVNLFFDHRAPLYEIYNITHDKPDLDQEFPAIAEELGFPVEIVEFSQFAKQIENEPDDSAYSLFKQLYKNDEDLMATYTASKAVRIWMEGAQNFWVSRKVVRLIPDHYKRLDSSLKCLKRDLQFAKTEGYFEKFGLTTTSSEKS